jgi:hypothetical protein
MLVDMLFESESSPHELEQELETNAINSRNTSAFVVLEESMVPPTVSQ